MANDEASWLALDRRPGETLRNALERSLREAILSGALREGATLPSSRRLADQLEVSRGVVSDGYGQLEAEGFISTRPRGAPIVAPVRQPLASSLRPEIDLIQPRFDLSPTTPDVTLFPVSRWLAAAQRVTRRVTTDTFDYREPRGERDLREVLAEHLGRTRGVITDPRQITVVQGTAQGIDLLLRLVRARGGTRVAVEDPSHSTVHERIRAAGLTLVPQPVDPYGAVVDGLEADAIVVTPAHQFPTGYVLSGERRRALLAWARATGGLVVEDDYDSEFRYDREPIRALQGLAPDHVVYLGTVSKTLAPALRLGWIVAPSHLADDVRDIKRLVDDFSPALDQLILCDFIRRGDHARQVRRARGLYRLRRDQMLAALEDELPGLPIEGIAAGVHLVLRLPAGVDDKLVTQAAEREGIRVRALSDFRVRPSRESGLVIGYGRLPGSMVRAAIHALANVIAAS
jgi:GntR family transcriptional regulator / MocR family aminotransferase